VTTNCNQANTAPSDAVLIVPTPRGNLPNSLGASDARENTVSETTLSDELKTIADTVEMNGGWNIAALKIHQAIERIAQLEAALKKIVNSCTSMDDAWARDIAIAALRSPPLDQQPAERHT
jgi:hypothetical protein